MTLPRRLPLSPFLLVTLACGCGGSVGASADGGTDRAIVIPIPDAARHDASADTTRPPVDAGADAADAGRDAPAPPAVTAVTLASCDVSAWNATVMVGGQPFQMTVDTGSTTLGVASTMCTACGASPEYMPGAGAVDEHQTGTSQYGSGSWSGEIYQDTVKVGAGPTVPDKLVAIDSQSNFFGTLRCAFGPQGILGMGPAGAAVPGTQGFFDQLVGSANVTDIFATELCDSGGTLWLGGYDPAVLTAAPQYTPLAASFISQYYYAVGLTSITVNGATVAVGTAQYPDSVVDTGTSIVILPTAAFTQITRAIGADASFKQIFGFGGGDAGATTDAGSRHDAAADADARDATADAVGADATASDAATDVNGASWFSSPGNCVPLSQTKAELDAALPHMMMSFGSSPAIAVDAVATESYLVPHEGFWCPALYAMAPGPNFPLAAILGSPILRSNVVIFDRANQRIGFAPHTACP